MIFKRTSVFLASAVLGLLFTTAASAAELQSPEDREAYILTDLVIEKVNGELSASMLAPCNTEYKGIALLSSKASKSGFYFIAASMKKKAASCTGWPKKKTVSLAFLPAHLKNKFIPFPHRFKKGVWLTNSTHNTAVSDKKGLDWQELQVIYKAKTHSPTLLMPNQENGSPVLRVSTLQKKTQSKAQSKMKAKHLLAKLPLSRLAKNRVLIRSEYTSSDVPRSFKLFSAKIHQAISRESDGSLFTAILPCGYVPLGVMLHGNRSTASNPKSTYSVAGYRDHRIEKCSKEFDVYDIEMPMIQFAPGKMATFNPQTLPKDQEFKLVTPARIKWQNKNIYGNKASYSLAYKTYNACEQGVGTLFSLAETGSLHVGQVTAKTKTCTPKFKPQVQKIPAIWGSSWQGSATGVKLGSS